MKLEQLRIAIRPRRDWEAVDLGLLIARQWWWPMQRIWLLITLPWLLIGWIVPTEYLWLVSLSLWWCKPLFERPLLMILSRGIFGVTPSTREILHALPQLFLNQLVMSLTLRRFSFTRSMDLPVIQLEGLRGQERRDRLNVLHRDDSGPASWLTIIGVHVESFIMFAGAALLVVFIPAEIDLDIWSWEFWGESKVGGLLLILFSYIAMALVAPVFVACGFSLYLNRRVKLEGWDIEIAFKRMAQKRGLQTFALATALAFFMGASLTAPPAQADEPEEIPERAEVREQIIAIKNGPDFHRMKTVREVKEKPRPEAKPNKGFFSGLAKLFIGMGKVMRGLATMAEIALWVIVVAAIVWVALKYGSWLNRFPVLFQRRRSHTYQPQTLFGMSVTEESLPSDVDGTALELWQRQQPRQALALLYRASLARLLQAGVPLREDYTELECLRLANHLQKELHLPANSLTYFSQLTQAWRQLAYGHVTPDDAHGQNLCRNWTPHWRDLRASDREANRE